MEHNYELVHNEAQSQYEYHIEGKLARLVYKEEDGVLHLTNTYVPQELGGRGIAGALVKDVFADIEKRGLKMKPACSYIVKGTSKSPLRSAGSFRRCPKVFAPEDFPQYRQKQAG